MAINLTLAVGWKTATQPSNSIPVYNCTSGGVNPVTWGYFETVGMEMTRRFPMENILWYPGGSYKENRMVNSLCEVMMEWNECDLKAGYDETFQFVQHTVPAHLCDTVLWLLGRKQFMVRLVQRMHKGSRAVEYFAVNEWQWDQDNVTQLRAELSDSDRKTFYFDVSLINWGNYLEDYIKGTRQYFFKEDLSTMEQARKHQRTMFWVDKIFQVVFCPDHDYDSFKKS